MRRCEFQRQRIAAVVARMSVKHLHAVQILRRSGHAHLAERVRLNDDRAAIVCQTVQFRKRSAIQQRMRPQKFRRRAEYQIIVFVDWQARL